MIKLFACDLDGTLFNAFHRADRTIIRAIREVSRAGARVAIATGRTVQHPSVVGLGDAPVEIVSSNGAIVRDARGGLIAAHPMDASALAALLDAFPDGLFRRVVLRGMRGNRAALDAGLVFDQVPEQVLAHEICKVNCRVPDPERRAELHAYLDAQDVIQDAPFDPVMFEITGAGVDKGASVAALAAHYGATEDEVAVYGDGGNDIAMLGRFRHAYATSNGSDAAKRAAGTVIGSCALHAVPRHMVATVRAERSHVRLS